eukprot:scaffold574_cov190-Amphora_coffeaeformis.AAC.7
MSSGKDQMVFSCLVELVEAWMGRSGREKNRRNSSQARVHQEMGKKSSGKATIDICKTMATTSQLST